MGRTFSLALILVLALASPAFAQKSLRWKLKPGDKFQVNITQQTTSTVTISSKPVKTTLEMSLETLWSVDDANEKQGKITQTVKRISVKMQSGTANPIVYDSAAPGAPVGGAKEIAAAVKPLLEEGSAIVVTMDLRGDVLSAEPSAKLAELWKAGDKGREEKTSDGERAKELLKRTLVLLPEKPVTAADAGQQKWSREREIQIAIGQVKQTTEFVYAGETEEDGRKLDKIEFSSQLALTPTAKALKLTIKEQKQTGLALFSADEGRVVSAEQTQKLVTEAPYRETNIAVTVESTVKTVIAPLKKE